MSIAPKHSNFSILDPDPRWFIYDSEKTLNFPKLYYIPCGKIKIEAPDSSLILGGSYSHFCGRPFHFERCSILEEQYMPYDLNTKHFQVRHGVLLWPLLNLYSYTDLNSPETVYIKSKMSNEFIAMFKFRKSHIELYETVD